LTAFEHPLAGPTNGRILTGMMFFPRGGSAFVARSLAFGLGRLGWQVTLVAGSDASSQLGDAGVFYAGLDVRPVDYAPALASLAAGGAV
jgi:hypothetical protein